MTVKILVFADLHYFGGSEKLFNADKKLVEYAEPMLEEFIRIADDDDVSLVVNLGDIIQDTNDKELDIRCLEYIFGKLKAFKCPVYSVLGNHDLKMMDSVSEVEKIMGYESSVYSVDHEGFHLVFLTTGVRPELGLLRGGSYKTQYLSGDSILWLKNDLENNRLPCLIFTHFPLAEDESVQDECMFMKNRDEVKAIINGDKNVKAVFSGHQHRPKEICENGLDYYIAGSPTTSPEADGIPLGVYMIIETEGENIMVTKKNLEMI